VKLSHKTAKDAKEALNRVRIQREIIDEFPEYANYHLFGDKIASFALLQRVMMGNIPKTLNLITRLGVSLEEFIEETLKTLLNEAVDLGTIEETVQNLVQLKTKALETHGIEVVEQNVSIMTRIFINFQVG